MEETIEIDTPTRLQQIFADFAAHGAPVATTTTTYLFRLTGDGGGQHLLTLAPGNAQWTSDFEGDADVVVTLDTDDFIAIADGEIDGAFAVASERIEIDGDRQIALSMIDQVFQEEAEA